MFARDQDELQRRIRVNRSLRQLERNVPIWQSNYAIYSQDQCKFERIGKSYATLRKPFRLQINDKIKATNANSHLMIPASSERRHLFNQISKLLRNVYARGHRGVGHFNVFDSIHCSTDGSFKSLTPTIENFDISSTENPFGRSTKKSDSELEIQHRLQRSKRRTLASASYKAPDGDKACDGLNLDALEEIKRDNLRQTFKSHKEKSAAFADITSNKSSNSDTIAVLCSCKNHSIENDRSTFDSERNGELINCSCASISSSNSFSFNSLVVEKKNKQTFEQVDGAGNSLVLSDVENINILEERTRTKKEKEDAFKAREETNCMLDTIQLEDNSRASGGFVGEKLDRLLSLFKKYDLNENNAFNDFNETNVKSISSERVCGENKRNEIEDEKVAIDEMDNDIKMSEISTKLFQSVQNEHNNNSDKLSLNQMAPDKSFEIVVKEEENSSLLAKPHRQQQDSRLLASTSKYNHFEPNELKVAQANCKESGKITGQLCEGGASARFSSRVLANDDWQQVNQSGQCVENQTVKCCIGTKGNNSNECTAVVQINGKSIKQKSLPIECDLKNINLTEEDHVGQKVLSIKTNQIIEENLTKAKQTSFNDRKSSLQLHTSSNNHSNEQSNINSIERRARDRQRRREAIMLSLSEVNLNAWLPQGELESMKQNNNINHRHHHLIMATSRDHRKDINADEHLYATVYGSQNSSPDRTLVESNNYSGNNLNNNDYSDYYWNRIYNDYEENKEDLFMKQLDCAQNHYNQAKIDGHQSIRKHYTNQQDTMFAHDNKPKKSLLSRLKSMIIPNNNKQQNQSIQFNSNSETSKINRRLRSGTMTTKSSQNLLSDSMRYLTTSRKSINLGALDREEFNGNRKSLISGFLTLGRRTKVNKEREFASQIFKVRGKSIRQVNGSGGAPFGSIDSLPSADSGLSCSNIQHSSSSEEHYPMIRNVNHYTGPPEILECHDKIRPDSENDMRIVIGRARAKVDCNPCAYDKEALVFKRGDIIEIIERHQSGTWIGSCNDKVGHFKFIDVTELTTDESCDDESNLNDEATNVNLKSNASINFKGSKTSNSSGCFITKLEIKSKKPYDINDRDKQLHNTSSPKINQRSKSTNLLNTPHLYDDSIRRHKGYSNETLMSSLEQLLHAIGLAEEQVSDTKLSNDLTDNKNDENNSYSDKGQARNGTSQSYLQILNEGGINDLDSFSNLTDGYKLDEIGIMNNEHQRRLLMAAKIIRQALKAARLDFIKTSQYKNQEEPKKIEVNNIKSVLNEHEAKSKFSKRRADLRPTQRLGTQSERIDVQAKAQKIDSDNEPIYVNLPNIGKNSDLNHDNQEQQQVSDNNNSIDETIYDVMPVKRQSMIVTAPLPTTIPRPTHRLEEIRQLRSIANDFENEYDASSNQISDDDHRVLDTFDRYSNGFNQQGNITKPRSHINSASAYDLRLNFSHFFS